MLVHFSFVRKKTCVRGSHPSSHGGAKDLVVLCVHEIENAMLEGEVELLYHHYMECLCTGM